MSFSVHRSIVLSCLFLSALASAQVTINQDIVIVPDLDGGIVGALSMENSSIFPSHQEQFCRAAYNAARSTIADEFDGVFAFSAADQTISDLENVWQGTPIRPAALNIGRDPPGYFTTNTYNSNRLSQCVFMGTLGKTRSFIGTSTRDSLPPNPDDDWSPSLGISLPFASLTGIEMMGHEYGHQWLLGMQFDQADGRGRQHFIRAFLPDDQDINGGHPNQHYSRFADSRSVMYGECITDLGNGSIRSQGCVRKYSHIDQYLMGLRPACAVQPMKVWEEASNPGRGSDSLAMSRTASPVTTNNLVKHEITGDEIVAAMGRRNPEYPATKKCWRVAFLVVLAPGQTTVPPAMLAKLQAYKNKWPTWFNFATDGRGFMDARATGAGCNLIAMDGGAGAAAPIDFCATDGGVFDAGAPEVDAGTADAGQPDAGEVFDAGTPDAGQEEVIDAGVTPEEPNDGGSGDVGRRFVRDGCSCNGVSVSTLFGLFVVALHTRRRRSR